jgi:hypothetical protein
MKKHILISTGRKMSMILFMKFKYKGNKVSPNINGKEFQQETSGDVMNDSGNSLHYKIKKRKWEKEKKNI